jgi:beta-glucosidase
MAMGFWVWGYPCSVTLAWISLNQSIKCSIRPASCILQECGGAAHLMIQFPKDFLWGAATSAHQVEGNNVNNDWWEWEKRVGLKETSGLACRHYELYKYDFDLAKLLNHNAHRLSIEWSRVEPKENSFSQHEIEHYIDVILALKARGLEPVVTLHHFTNPLWFIKTGGWQNKNAYDYFLRYVSKIVEALADKVNYWVTINEPMVYVYHGFILGLWPPQEKSFLKGMRVKENLAIAHTKAYRLIHSIYKKRNLPPAHVSIGQNVQAFTPCNSALKNRFAAYLRNRLFNFEFIDRLIRSKSLDFIGINYYTRGLVDVDGWAFRHMAHDTCKKNHSPLAKNSLGWDIYPQGIYNLLIKFKKYNLPLFILENGICIEDDKIRWNFIYEHLNNVHRAMQEGLKVLGYIYWSLIDNYEWDKGYGHRFGLIEVDYSNFGRIVRESAKRFALVCKTGVLE